MMIARNRAHSLRTPARRARGFTLVELMVAVTGGLFVSLAVFAIARESGRFYTRESRISDATLGAVLGFERLKTDIARAGFLASPNIRSDPRLCGNATDPTWPVMIRSLAGVQIKHQGSPANATLAANNLHPDSITLAGSYSGAEEFPVWNVENAGGAGFTVYLQEHTGPLARQGYATSTNQLGLLKSIFGPGRALRIQDQSGEVQFGQINDVAITPPRVTLKPSPALRFRQQAGSVCGLKGNVTGAVVNVVNFVRYEVKKATTPAYADAYLYGGHPYDLNRTDLVRTEVAADGTLLTDPTANTEEVVAEYAVNLQFGVTLADTMATGTPASLLQLAPGDVQIKDYAGDVTTEVVNPSVGPQRLRVIRARLAVRSQEPDRMSAPPAPGLIRIGLGTGGDAPFARVRTVQADIALNNQMAVTY